MRRLFYLIFVAASVVLIGASKHTRDGSALPPKEKEFAKLLSVQKRRIFCGQFNKSQRLEAIKYARGRGMDACFTPDEAVIKVMEETGMSLAIKRKGH